jgi:hypothetical protein
MSFPSTLPGRDARLPAAPCAAGGQRVACWLHGPEEEIPERGKEPLERAEIAIAEEA